jgi:ribosomal protein L11 methyltransferase
MPWLQLHIKTNPENAETLNAFLNLLGAVAITLQDAADEPILEPALNTTPLWSHTEIIALFPEKIDINKVIDFLKKQLPPSPAFGTLSQRERGQQEIFEYHIELLEDQNWERTWLDHFKPMCFGKRLWICPSTQTPPDPNAVNIILDPGLAFGTGTHPTTALCLEWLDANDLQNKTVIDYGCGSGILAIAALKLGAKEAWAIDYDPQALDATRENARRNHIDENKLHVLLPEKFNQQETSSVGRHSRPVSQHGVNSSGNPVDILLANILANPLIELSPRFAQLLKPNGQLVLSGILENQTEMITRAYQNKFKNLSQTTRDEWVRIDAVKTI